MPLLVAHTTLLEISCRGSNMVYTVIDPGIDLAKSITSTLKWINNPKSIMQPI